MDEDMRYLVVNDGLCIIDTVTGNIYKSTEEYVELLNRYQYLLDSIIKMVGALEYANKEGLI